MKRLDILQVSTTDIAGGAERVAWNLFQAYRKLGHGSFLAVGQKRSSDAGVIPLNQNNKNGAHDPWARFCHSIAKIRNSERFKNRLYLLGKPKKLWDLYLGHEDFNFPETWQLLNLKPEKPDIIHCHNLHGGYFDLRSLPQLSQQIPVVLTLHDAWLLSGHCAHSFDCERWKTGCGRCPDLTLYPAVRRDGTAYNWKRKREIFSQSKLYVSTPCQWLMERIKQSILLSGAIETRVIPYGVDLTIFHRGDSMEVRKKLGLPLDAAIILFVANNFRTNIWKDFRTLKIAIEQVAARLENLRLVFLGIGENPPAEKMGRAEVHFIPSKEAGEKMALYYQAADIYVHAAKVDTFPNVILEALACGVPVVATQVGGVPEQVKALDYYGINEANGILVPPRDPEAMASSVARLLSDEGLRRRLSENASRDARERFDLERQVHDHLNWYYEILEKSERECGSSRQ